MAASDGKTNANDIRENVEKLEKQYGVELDLHTEVDDTKWILHVHAASVTDYIAIKSRLKGKDISQ